MRPLLLTLLLALALPSWATHILGGEMYYTYLGNDNYQVTLRLYRDCGPDNSNNTALDASVAIGVFNQQGAILNVINLSLPGELMMPVVVSNPCLSAPPSICTRQGIYTGTIHLPSGTGGYTLGYQRCCRSPAMTNIINSPNQQGMTCTVQIPDPTITGPNSSPSFDDDPPMVLCLGQTVVLPQVASDADGDSLVYALCDPLDGADSFNPMPLTPSAPPYSSVAWAPGFSTLNQLNSTPAMTYGMDNGLLTVHPTSIGSFAVGISVSEYRNGQLLSTVIRDFRYLVVACNPAFTSAFAGQESSCDGLEATMVNQSNNAGSYHWDFGVPGIDSDTSSLENPSYTYPGPGTYTISLVANPGWPCADTAYQTYTVKEPLEVSFTAPPILCMNELPLTLSATGNFTGDASLLWDFGPGVSPDLHSPVTSVGWSTLGDHPVTVSVNEDGCSTSYTDTVRVYPLPQPLFTADTTGCIPLELPFHNTSTAWTPMEFLWDFGDGTTSTDSLPWHVYEEPGVYTVSLTVSTDEGCVATRTLTRPNLIAVWPVPQAMATAIPNVTSVLEPDVTFNDYSTDAAISDFVVEGVHYDTRHFVHTFSDAGWYTAFLTVTSDMGCTDTTSVRIFITDHLFFAPTAFTPNGDDINEVWKPLVKGAREYRLDVFNRWGEVVFSTTDPEAGWDGRNGLPGIYAYKAWLTEWGPSEREYNGSFMLIR